MSLTKCEFCGRMISLRFPVHTCTENKLRARPIQKVLVDVASPLYAKRLAKELNRLHIDGFLHDAIRANRARTVHGKLEIFLASYRRWVPIQPESYYQLTDRSGEQVVAWRSIK